MRREYLFEADDFKEQSYISESGTMYTTLDSVVKDMKQYALKVDLLAVQTSCSPELRDCKKK